MGIIATPGILTGWPSARPEELGLSPDMGSNLDAGFAAGDYEGLHGFLAVRHGKLAVERYFDGSDEFWGKPLADPNHGPALLHDCRSISKSIVGLLYGIALHDGMVPPTHVKLADVMPDYADLLDDPLKRRITVGHVLSMRMGIDWHEHFSYADPENGEIRMEEAADRYRYILGLPMASRPGAKWVYSGGATAILGYLIERGTAARLEDYARDRLLGPLGIESFEWILGSDGRAAASSGLRLTARDLARIGQMVLDRGLWNARRVVPAGWIATAMKPRAFVETGLRYGYQWWLGNLVATGKPWSAAFGNGGQRLFIIPSLNMLVVVFAGNYNADDQWKMPVKLMAKIVIPGVVEG